MKSKSKFTKIILFALALVMVFGTIWPSAFESYDTYTYSIDGEPLRSPAAYTPSPTTYDSGSMGLLSGNNWRYDDDGDVGIWAGDMTPAKVMKDEDIALSFDSEDMVFILNSDGVSYTAQSFGAEKIGLINDVLAKIAEYRTLYPEAEGAVAVSFGGDDIKEANPYKIIKIENALAAVEYYLNAKITAAAEANPESALFAVIDDASVIERLYEALSWSRIAITVPATYDDMPVTAIADNFLNSADPIAATLYSKVTDVVIGKNVVAVGANAIADATAVSNVYYESTEENWAKISIDSTNSKLTSATRYYYSASRKYGNSELQANDIVADNEGNLYIADKGNNRIVVLNKHDFSTIGVMRNYVDEYGRKQILNNPTGVFVTDPNKMVDGSSHIFVCDNGNERIVVFDRDYNYVRTIEKPENALLQKDGNNAFVPYAIAVDIYGRIFVVSQTCYQGVIVMSNDGEFTGFIGAQKVTYDVIEQIWRRFQSAADRTATVQNLSIPFNNITVDDYGFVYVTINFSEKEDMQKQYESIKSKEATYSPVKKLNSTGVEIMKRNGFFDPGGEVDLFEASEVSKIIDVAIGDEGSWSILDTAKLKSGSMRSRIFTYDSNGNLLFAFGDSGDQVGNGENYVGMTYQILPTTKIVDGVETEDTVYNLILLDSTETGDKIIVYTPTEYCDKIMSALHNENNHNYSDTITDWQNVLTSNNNFDLAYIGIGKALYNQGKYDEAMDMLSSAYETEYYAKAFAEVRKGILSVWMIPVIIGIVALLVLFFKFLGWAKKKNKATSLKVGRKTYFEELLYAFHLVFHPFDGFWDLKHEKRGSVRAATTILGLTVVAFFYQAIGQGYMFNPRGDYSTVFIQVIAILVPVLLWVISNWCLTTLFDGEGSLKDIYIATCYSLAPLPLFVILSTILTNIFTVSEGSMVTLLVTIGWIWVALLLFFGMAVTHDYTNGKNLIAILGTVVAMAVIMFIAILFSSLVVKMVTFIISIFTEIGNRF